MKENSDSNKMVERDFNMLLLLLDRSIRQKLNNETLILKE